MRAVYSKHSDVMGGRCSERRPEGTRTEDRNTENADGEASLSRSRARELGRRTCSCRTAPALGATSALAGIKQEFQVFKNCPYETPGVVQCVTTMTSGEFHLGAKTVPVEPKVVVLQGGLPAEGTELVPPTNGETLSKTPLMLPGGLIGIELLPPLTEVTATAELVGPINVSVPNEASGQGDAVGDAAARETGQPRAA